MLQPKSQEQRNRLPRFEQTPFPHGSDAHGSGAGDGDGCGVDDAMGDGDGNGVDTVGGVVVGTGKADGEGAADEDGIGRRLMATLIASTASAVGWNRSLETKTVPIGAFTRLAKPCTCPGIVDARRTGIAASYACVGVSPIAALPAGNTAGTSVPQTSPSRL